MKYSIEKIKKFQKGGKSPKEIMEEARRNQAIWRQQQEEDISAAIARDAANTAARDAVYNSGIPAYQSQPVVVNMPNSYMLDRINPDRRTYTMGNSNLPEVVITAKDLRPRQRPAPITTPTRELPPEREVVIPPNIEKDDSTRVVYDRPSLEIGVKDEVKNYNRDWSQVQAPNIDLGTIRAGSRPKRIDWGWLRRKIMGLNQGSILYQQGGQLPSYQQGGTVSNFKNWISSLTEIPNKHQVNSNTYTTYTKRDPFIGRSSETRSIVGPNGQVSSMVIKGIAEEDPSKIDTTFISPGYIKDPDLYPKFTPQDIREGNRKGKGKGSYLEKFTSPTYFPHIGKHQQGGKAEASTDELYVDFAIRYLKAKGISEDNMVDNEGGLKDEFLEEISTAINEVDTPDFWEQYQSNPDAVVQSYVESKMEPEQIEMARKGAKLKKLKKGGMKSRKCKCGCNLTMKKEAGGTIKEVCACGCKK